MNDILDKPPPIAAPPDLPPYLHKRRGGGGRRTIIMPSIQHAGVVTKIYDTEQNWITIVYQWMNKIVLADGSTIFDSDAQWFLAHTAQREYRRWLETYEPPERLPPHIQFGGGIKAKPGGDPTFYDRWVEYARRTFV